MSVFTPGHFTDLTGDAEAESGWQTPDEREEPRRDARERKVRRERDSVRGEGGLVPLVDGEALQILQNARPEFFEEIFVQDLCGHLVRDPFA